jgi:hexosaminidase
MSPTLTLTTRWSPASDPASYELRLTSDGDAALGGFMLGVSGPALGVGPRTEIEGATLVSQLSNHLLLAPAAGFVLAPGEDWRIVLRGMPHPLRHWTDGVAVAYLVLAGGETADVGIARPEPAASDETPMRGAERFPVSAGPEARLSVIPWPNSVAAEGARATPAGLEVHPGTEAGRAAAAAFTMLTADLFPAEGLVRPAAEGGMPVLLNEDAEFEPEAYELTFEHAGAAISASTRTGFLYGLVTLGQIVRGARAHPDTLVVPARGTITDQPALRWRGSHLDSARHFYASAEIRRFLELLAWNKMNHFHWHLSDDEAWRVEIDAFPELTRIGAWRGHGLPLPPLLGTGARPTGGYYGKAAIREIVALGKALGIAIVPEIDMPGHCYAALQSLPALRDPGETGEYRSVQGFPNNCLNPAHEPTYAVIETIIDELLALFPSGIFHLGADEVPLAAWSGSPEALALLERLAGREAADRHRARAGTVSGHSGADAIEGSDTATLQAHFIGRVHACLRSRGVVTGGWEEAAHGGVLDKAESYLVGWRNTEISAALAEAGHDIVVAPGQRYYLDMANGPDWAEPGAGWAGSSSPEETYLFEPREGWTEAQLAHLLGVQTCIWSEPMANGAVFDRLVFPRLSAVAETGWTLPERKSWERFRGLSALMPLMYGHWRGDGMRTWES